MKFNLAICSILFFLLPYLIQANFFDPYPNAFMSKSTSDCSHCFCQCKDKQFYDPKSGQMMGNCKSYVKSMDGNWRVWCYVKENINGNQQTTCSDIQMSRRYPGELWSRHACVTP